MNRQLLKARHLVITSILAISGLSIFLFLAYRGKGFDSLLLTSFFAGSIGGVVNNYRRLFIVDQNKVANSNIADKSLEGWLVVAQIYLSPIMGGIFAVVLYLLFVTGNLEGSFFPEFEPAKYTTFKDFLHNTNPVHNTDAAKVLFWSFIAGFSEKYVPGILDKFSTRK